MHMPAHKGVDFLGFEKYDITEINGADSLYEASGIIAESEANASELFGCPTLYSTEGSSHCIRAMLYMAKVCGYEKIIAGRNAHKTFLSALALLDIDVEWIYPSENESYLSCNINADTLDKMLADCNCKTAVYITSPDYLGNIADIAEISRICKEHSALLLVDNAHGTYLKFLPASLHPIDLGADICCDSAHKTLPVLTGGAYLHISKNADARFIGIAKNALSLFGSTSPSYLILQSLDHANLYLYNGYKEKLAEYISEIRRIKQSLTEKGYTLSGNEATKIVLDAKRYGYYGSEIADILEKSGIFCEFADKDYTVLMLSLENGVHSLNQLSSVLCDIPKKDAITAPVPCPARSEMALSVREAFFAQSEKIKAGESLGRILAQFNISCPPAVPIAVCGEIINENAVKCFEYYGINEISVIK